MTLLVTLPLKEKSTPVLRVSQEIEQRTLPNSFSEAIITLIPMPEKITTTKLQNNVLTDAKTLNKIIVNSTTSKRLLIMTKWDLFLDCKDGFNI